jgi:hypothetical protein
LLVDSGDFLKPSQGAITMSKPAEFAMVAVSFLIALPRACATDNFAVETIFTGLKNPCGVAIRPGESTDRYEIFVADSGAGRIIRLTSDAPQTGPVEVVTGFALSQLGDINLTVGPTGLLFLDCRRMVVGVSGDDGASVRLFELAEGAAALAADSPKQQIKLKSDRGGLNHAYAIARTQANETVRDALVITCFDNDSSGDVRTIILRADVLTELTLLTASKVQSEITFPAAVAIGDGGYIVVGWIGSLRTRRDSRLTFYNPVNGATLMELSTDLHDIQSLAYSPRTGNLYAADAAWMEPKDGGLFRVDAANEPGAFKCVAVKVADVKHPSALAFGPDGALYITAVGDPGENNSQGVLLRVTGDL